jgi:hypothetical protein
MKLLEHSEGHEIPRKLKVVQKIANLIEWAIGYEKL